MQQQKDESVWKEDQSDATTEYSDEQQNDVLSTDNTASNQKLQKVGNAMLAWDKIINVMLAVVICVFVAVLLLKVFFLGHITVSGDSMNPNLTDGNVVWVNKTAQPQRGDIVVFYLNDVNKFQAEFAFGQNAQKGGFAEKYIKRVVALEGDKLWVEKVQDDYVLVIQTPNGVLRENYYTVFGENATFFDMHNNKCDVPTLGNLGNLRDTTESNPYVVAQGCFYAMGDNRHNSTDSRKIGNIPLSRLYGVVMQ